MSDLRDRCPDCGDEDHHGCGRKPRSTDAGADASATARKRGIDFVVTDPDGTPIAKFEWRASEITYDEARQLARAIVTAVADAKAVREG